MCEPGSYSSSFNSETCDLCVAGTYSNSYGMGFLSQCTPCAYGTYADQPGSTFCKDCVNPADCSVGSTMPRNKQANDPFSQIQPLAYDNGGAKADSATASFQFALLAALVFTWVMYFIMQQAEFFKYFDIFSQRHERKYYEDPYKTPFGGFVTIVFVLAALLFIISPIILYSMANIVETKTLVPVFTLENRIFYASFMYTRIKMYNYGGECGDAENRCLGHIDLAYLGSTSVANEILCYSEENSCVTYLSCSNCTVEEYSEFSITVWGYLAYSTDIAVEVGIYSSIPDSNLSLVKYYLSAPQGQVFNGLNPTILPLSMIPSVIFI